VASSSAPVHPYRWLALFLALLIGVYLLVFLTGDKRSSPKLGIDLQGGTRVTLTARTPDGSRPTRDALNQAQQIIGARVNGLGVSGSEVVIDGDNLVITVPGNDGNEARNLGQTARLFIRPVIGQPIPIEAIKQQMQAAAPGGAPPGVPAPGAPPPGAPAPAPAAGEPAAPPPRTGTRAAATSVPARAGSLADSRAPRTCTWPWRAAHGGPGATGTRPARPAGSA
jgi:preprotein translocase subunit SecD